MSRFSIIGGGLSGLSAALFLKQKMPDSSVTVVETSNRFGGWIETLTSSNTTFEIGPRSVRVASPTSPYLLRLVESIGLADKIIFIPQNSVAAKKRYVYVHGNLFELNPKLLRPSPPFKQPLLPMLVASFLKDKDLVNRINQEDMSVDEYFRLHFNDELADIAVNSMIRGIFAGDSKTLGVKSVFPQIIKMEQESKGLIRGMAKQFVSTTDAPLIESPLHERALKEKWSIWSLEGGLERIIDGLVNHLNEHDVSLLLNSRCSAIDVKISGEVECRYESPKGNGAVTCDHVFLATSSNVCSDLLRNVTDESLHTLLDVPYVDVAVVGMEFQNTRLPVEGFGHLIPSWEIPHVLGIVYDSCLFPHRENSEASSKLTCMIGGSWFNEYCSGMSELDFLRLAQDVVASQLGITSRPSEFSVRINRQCIPQYPIGHQDKIAKVRRILSDSRLPISLIGSSFDGVSVNDCVASAFNSVKFI